MKIKIQSLHFQANAQLKEYVQEKLNKLSHLNDQIISGDVCLKLENSKKLENKLCEIRLTMPGKDLFAKRQCKTFEEATNETVDALQQQIKKRKTKINKGKSV